MEAKHRRRHRVLERAVVDHRLCAALATFVAFLVGLEQEFHRARKLGLVFGKDLRDAHQDRDMAVVAAGVHDANHAAHPRRLDLRGEGQVDLLLDRERIHVGAQRNHAARLAAFENADHAGVAHAGLHFDAELLQVFGHERRSALLMIRELGILMDVPPPGDHLVLDPERRRRDPFGDLVARLRHHRVHHPPPILCGSL